MTYLKIDKDKIIEAPYIIARNGRIIHGYNKESNQTMLFSDGYSKFELPADCYTIKDGQIIEKEFIPTIKTTFTKLEIRRAMRQLGIEDILDQILSENPQLRNDWNDAQEINLDDPLIQEAINNGLISQETLNSIKDFLR